ncbi:MAG TPA: lysozyme inhibitor LprI family protein [Desulfovibrio sp.]|uniref:lysozyme inhibitor LprI family protein n=1 Tax=Desulfovibrio sp. TaxID=885 RepID=UPI002BF62894|nr:lysozyme inhibitor LprI family protein [Desulfovibrio sp.]HMM39475.1 lysozyme inhibitor LprI family protein [Desulfovibrio sp.]
MNRSILLSLVALLGLATGARAASFPCEDAANDAEVLVCGDYRLSVLDEQLDAVYRVALKAKVPDLTEEQKDWLEQVRDRCPDAEGLALAYRERIAALVKAAKTARRKLSDFDFPLLTPAKAKTVCGIIAERAKAGTLRSLEAQGRDLTQEERARFEPDVSAPTRMTTLRDRFNGRNQGFLTANSGGSCNTSWIMALDDRGRPLADGQDGDPSDFGSADFVLTVKGEPYVVRADAGLRRPTLVRGLREGALAPLCGLETSGDRGIMTKSGDDAACRAALAGKLRPLDWEPLDFCVTAENRDKNVCKGGLWERSAVARADLDGDGKPELLGRVGRSWTGGCGGVLETLVLLSPETLEIIDEAYGGADSPINQGITAKEVFLLDCAPRIAVRFAHSEEFYGRTRDGAFRKECAIEHVPAEATVKMLLAD